MNVIPFQTTPPSTQARLDGNHNTSDQPDAIEISIGLGLVLKLSISKSKSSFSLKTVKQKQEDSL